MYFEPFPDAVIIARCLLSTFSRDLPITFHIFWRRDWTLYNYTSEINKIHKVSFYFVFAADHRLCNPIMPAINAATPVQGVHKIIQKHDMT